MKFSLIQFNKLLHELGKRKPLEENFSQIVRTIEDEFRLRSLGIFLKIPKTDKFRLKIGRNLSHTFSKNAIYLDSDPLVLDLQRQDLLDIRSSDKYIFEHEFTHMLISPLIFHSKLLGFVFIDRDDGFYNSEDIAGFHLFSYLLSLTLHIDLLDEEYTEINTDDNPVPIYDHSEFLDRANIVFSMMKRYKRNMTLASFKIDRYIDLIRIHGQKKTNQYIQQYENIFVDNLRETDFIGILDKDFLVLLMPETSLQFALKTINRLKSYICNNQDLNSLKTGWGLCALHDKIPSFDDMMKTTFEAAAESTRSSNGEPVIVE